MRRKTFKIIAFFFLVCFVGLVLYAAEYNSAHANFAFMAVLGGYGYIAHIIPLEKGYGDPIPVNNLKPGSTATVASATAPDTKDNKQYLLLRSKNEVIAVFHLCNKKPALKAGDEVVVNNNGTLHTLQPKEEAEQG